MKDKYKILKQYFGHDFFRYGQEEIIDAVLSDNKQGVLCLMPTGGGKSLVYQLPSIIQDGLTIVVSPLISLMKDQVDALQKNGIDAAFYNSSQSKREQQSILQSLNMGLTDILYVSPERFGDNNFIEFLKDCDVNLFAVDEAHLISQYGHGFRPSYRKLKKAIKQLKPKRIVALTATATKDVQNDICEQLGIITAKKFIRGFYRPNLELSFTLSSSKTYSIISLVEDQLERKNKTGIVYTSTKANAEELSYLFNEKGISASFYHAGLKTSDRTKIQNTWAENGGLIIATCAFGMGIDRPDVRFVIHESMPGSIEAWYQEIGRAGRDGKKSICKTFYDPRDIALQKFFINLSMPRKEEIMRLWKWINRHTEYSLEIKATQERMKELSGCQFVSGAISFLKTNNLIKSIKRGVYKAKKHFESPYDIDKVVDWSKYYELRKYKFNMLNNIVELMKNKSECRMKQIVRYFGDNTLNKDCRNCDVCFTNYSCNVIL